MIGFNERAERAALRLVDDALRGVESDGAAVEALADTFLQLQTLMATVVGPIGYRAVVSRALHGTRQRELGWQHVTIAERPPVILSGLDGVLKQAGRDGLRKGAARLLTNIIGLHCAFIGEALTFRLLRRVWPLSDEDEAAPDAEES